jgi:uncharacterized membrane protein YqhA
MGVMMSKILENSKHLVLIAVLFLLLASVAAFLWGAVKTIYVLGDLIANGGKDPLAAVAFIELIDKFLIAIALYMSSVGLYELFYKELALPPWLVFHDLHDLKTRLSSVIILVMAVSFLEHLVEWKDPQGTLLLALAVAAISATLIAFNHFGEK